MSLEIKKWEEIERNFTDCTLLIGNGASMAIDSRFGYGSLIEHAKKYELMKEDVNSLFDFFETYDFELILRLVWQSTNINKALSIHDYKTKHAYKHVRHCLIDTVRSIHPEFQEVSDQIPQLYNFIKKFKTVLSLNYDLILYWAVMYGQSQRDNHEVKDCFVSGKFDEDWRRFREPLRPTNNTTLVFYPHGSLILCRDRIESEYKIITRRDSINLLESILVEWNSEKYVPIFVSEGTTEQKVNSIKNSNYLNTVYREVLTSIGRKLVIYGWNIGEHDMHILHRIAQSGVKEVAISVYKNDHAYCYRIKQIVEEKLGRDVCVCFFDSLSSNCWNN
ncbi:DUF4917 family protein [Providencia rettgeri]|uniref:DUF4917 family protein n=1 Tax=Providencia rettgeri TaxID=587 RepID=A0AAD2VXS6_PRORE|nr:DUF4917 family protein [Providencia rettgeri]ELR5220017.1 DUF4917 family protein [Providencia rettgeri]